MWHTARSTHAQFNCCQKHYDFSIKPSISQVPSASGTIQTINLASVSKVTGTDPEISPFAVTR
jgi:hypothetical protein